MNKIGVAATVTVFIASLTACQSRDTPETSPQAERDLRARASERAQPQPSPSPSSPAAHGAPAAPAGEAAYDLKFVDTMTAHHKSAIDMAKLVPTRAQHDELKQLAAKIEKDQAAEIEQMKAWREQWFAGKPQAADHMMPGMKESMQGMDMGKLRAAKGADFDHAFIDMMVRHHEGALIMAKDAQAKATKPELKEMASKVVAAQQKEIDQMKAWSASWFQGHKH